MKKFLVVLAMALFCCAAALADTPHASLVPVKTHHHVRHHHAHKAAKHHVAKRHRQSV